MLAMQGVASIIWLDRSERIANFGPIKELVAIDSRETVSPACDNQACMLLEERRIIHVCGCREGDRCPPYKKNEAQRLGGGCLTPPSRACSTVATRARRRLRSPAARECRAARSCIIFRKK